MCYNWSNLRSIFSTQFRLPVTSTQSDVQSNPSQQFFRYVRDDIMSKVISILTDRISKITSILRSCSPHVGKLQQYWLIARACYVTPSICNSNSIAFWSQNRYFIKNTFLEFFTIRWTRKENFLVSMQDYCNCLLSWECSGRECSCFCLAIVIEEVIATNFVNNLPNGYLN